MPSSCSVPNCRIEKTKVFHKISIFKVPKDDVLRKKWEVVIPGIRSLRSTQYVCERHFEEKCIVRRYIKYDNEGKIIADIPYQRPRLHADSVPSLFNNHIKPLPVKEYNKKSLRIPEGVYAIILSSRPTSNVRNKVVNNKPQAMFAKESYENSQIIANLGNQSNEAHYFNERGEINKNINLNQQQNCRSYEFDTTLDKQVTQEVPIIIKTETIDTHTTLDNQVTQEIPLIIKTEKTGKHITTLDNQVIQEAPITIKTENIDTYSTTVDNQVIQEAPITINTENTGTRTTGVTTEILSTASTLLLDHNYTISIPNEPTTINISSMVHIDSKNIILPKSWGISENHTKYGKRLVFTYTNIQTKDNIDTVVLSKCITIDFCDGKLSYFVNGCQLNQTHLQSLPNIFNNEKTLLPLLMTFQGINVCEGIGLVDLDLIKDSVTVHNSLNFGWNYHHNECTLISQNRKCENCKKLRKTILQRRNRSLKRSKKPNIILSSLSTMAYQKLLLLKRKTYREEKKRLRNFAKNLLN